MTQTQLPPMTEHTQRLPPLPKRFDVGTVLYLLAIALGSHNLVMRWLGIEPAWPQFPYGDMTAGTLLASIACSCLPSAYKPGLYAPRDSRRRLAILLAGVAVVAAVLVPSAVA